MTMTDAAPDETVSREKITVSATEVAIEIVFMTGALKLAARGNL